MMIPEEADRRNAPSACLEQNNMEEKAFLYVKSLFYM